MQAGGIQHTVEASHKDLVETRQALTSMQEELAETRQLLNEDALTGALNRRGLDQTLMREIARAQRLGVKLSLAMVDLDFFKKVEGEAKAVGIDPSFVSGGDRCVIYLGSFGQNKDGVDQVSFDEFHYLDEEASNPEPRTFQIAKKIKDIVTKAGGPWRNIGVDVTGVWDALSRAECRAVQRGAGLPETGELDDATLRALAPGQE
jgi:hypothetical protein